MGLNEPDPSDDESTYVKCLAKEKQQKNKDEMLAREHDLIFLSPILEGFALKNKLWRECLRFDCSLIITNNFPVNFYIDDIRPVNWNDDAYDHLVYPEEQKDLVLTFVENHQRMKAGVDDVIMGKGK